MLFNIYYMNFSKVYEIKMMISNIIKTEESIETNEQDQENSKLQAKMGVKFLKVFNSEIGGEVGGTSSDSQKVRGCGHFLGPLILRYPHLSCCYKSLALSVLNWTQPSEGKLNSFFCVPVYIFIENLDKLLDSNISP